MSNNQKRTPQEIAIEIAKELGYSQDVINAISKERNSKRYSNILCNARKAKAKEENDSLLREYYARTRGRKTTTRKWLI